MKVTHEGEKIKLDQIKYLRKLLDHFNMTNAKIASTPLPSGYTPLENKNMTNQIIHQKYQAIIRSLLYLMLRMRPDIAYVVIKMSQFLANPSQEHLDKAMHIIHYLVGTQNYAIVFDGYKGEGIQAFTDSDWTADQIKH